MSSCEICFENVNLLQIKNGVFNRLTFQEKIAIIKIGRCIPNLKLTQIKSIKVTWYFNIKFYESYQWVTGCVHENILFCSPCLLFSCSKNVWSSYGYQDLNYFKAAVKKNIMNRKIILIVHLNYFLENLIFKIVSINNRD